MPRGEHRRALHPVALDGELDLLLRLGGLQQVASKSIVPDERRLERILVILGSSVKRATQASPSKSSQARP